MGIHVEGESHVLVTDWSDAVLRKLDIGGGDFLGERVAPDIRRVRLPSGCGRDHIVSVAGVAGVGLPES
jgi:hypothetical protein